MQGVPRRTRGACVSPLFVRSSSGCSHRARCFRRCSRPGDRRTPTPEPVPCSRASSSYCRYNRRSSRAARRSRPIRRSSTPASHPAVPYRARSQQRAAERSDPSRPQGLSPQPSGQSRRRAREPAVRPPPRGRSRRLSPRQRAHEIRRSAQLVTRLSGGFDALAIGVDRLLPGGPLRAALLVCEKVRIGLQEVLIRASAEDVRH